MEKKSSAQLMGFVKMRIEWKQNERQKALSAVENARCLLNDSHENWQNTSLQLCNLIPSEWSDAHNNQHDEISVNVQNRKVRTR